MNKVSVVIVNLNGLRYLERCLNSLFAQTYGNFEVLLIDNASKDNSVEFVKANYPDVRVKTNSENIGFAPALNKGIELSDGEYVMSLNADIYLTPSFIEEIVLALEGDRSIGSAAGKLYKMQPDGSLNKSIDAVGHHIKKDRKVIGKRLVDTNIDNEYNSLPREVFGTPGCASIYKREMLEDIRINNEYLDNDFFAFFEDVDLDWRSQLRGWRCRYTPNAVGYHVRGGTGVRKNPKIEALVMKNGYLTIVKNDSISSVLKSASHIISRIAHENYNALQTDPRIPLFALALFFKGLYSSMSKRIKIQSRRRISTESIESWFE